MSFFRNFLISWKYALIVSFGLTLLSVTFALAEEKSWNFEKWQVNIWINKDSTFLVEEIQTINFYGNFHWLTRDISKQKTREISNVKVFEEPGRELKGEEIEIKEDKNQVGVKLNFDLTNAQKSWKFQYKVRGGLGYFENYDELYWNAVSSEREVPIKEVEVFVYLPEEVPTREIMQRLYVGKSGGTNQSFNYQVIDGKTLRFWGKNIAPYENFTIVAGWPKGLVYQPGIVKVISLPRANVLVDGKNVGLETPAVLEEGYEISLGEHTISVSKFGWKPQDKESATVFVKSGNIEELEFVLEKTEWFLILSFLPFLIPVVVAILIFRQWQTAPKIKKTIIAQYEPPENLSSVEVGGLVDFTVHSRDITAIIVDLAYRGYLKIIEKEKKILWVNTRKYSLEKTREIDDNLRRYEKSLLRTIFGRKNLIEIDKLKKKVSLREKLGRIKKAVFKKLVKEGYLEAIPRSGVKKLYFLVSLFLFFSGFITFNIFKNLALSFIIAGAVMFVDWFLRPAKLTEKGVEAKWQALGFKEYLQVAERFRLGACTPETFEKHLSFAIAFGVEKKWADRFLDIYKNPPDWFVSSQPASSFRVSGFTNSISSMSHSVTSGVTGAMASGSSGFGGGGGAGGGGGGGGSGAG